MNKPTRILADLVGGREYNLLTNLRWLAASLSLVVLVAACTATAPGDTTPAPEADGSQPASSNVPVADRTTPGTPPRGEAGVGDAQALLKGLDAEAIVAAEEQVLIGIYERTLPSVVQINVSRNLGNQPGSPLFPTPPDGDFFERGGGSGFVWDGQNHIVTNHHVVDGADRITVIFADRTQVEARVLGSDPDSDLAVLQVDLPDGPAPATPLGDSDAVRVGQMAAAIGNPFGQEFTITTGIVSAVGRTIRSGNSPFSIPEVIQTDAPINPGNSGGPLLDRKGHVIGVNTQIITRSGANSGIGFAVPINTAKRVVPALIESGRYEYAWLGISGVTLSPDMAELMGLPRSTRGTLVISVNEAGPADQAGIQGSTRTATVDGLELPLGGDVITAIDQEPITDMDGLITYLVNNASPGEQVTLDVIRGAQRDNVEVTLGKRPS